MEVCLIAQGNQEKQFVLPNVEPSTIAIPRGIDIIQYKYLIKHALTAIANLMDQIGVNFVLDHAAKYIMIYLKRNA